MDKNAKKKKRRRQKKNRRVIKIVILLLVLVAIIVLLKQVWGKNEPDNGDTLSTVSSSELSEDDGIENVSENDGEKSAEAIGLEFPYVLEEGKVIVHSLFASSIDNPDNEGKYGDDIASLEIENMSGETLSTISVIAAMDDGREISFEAQDIPSGKKAWCFAKQNEAIDVNAVCLELRNTMNLGTVSLMEDQVEVQANGTEITLSNNSADTLQHLIVDYHCTFDGIYFGGKVYSCTVEKIPAGESVTIQADECILGDAEVVSIRTAS